MTPCGPISQPLSETDVITRAAQIKLVVFDVDGVLTDGRLYLDDAGEEMKAFSSLDGHGLKMLRKSGVELAIITGRTSRLMEVRARNLNIAYLVQGAEDKLDAYDRLLPQLGFAPEQVAVMGDDVVDLPMMRRSRLSITVPPALDIMKQYAHYTTQRQPGRGAAREVCELIMRAQGTLDSQLAPYLK
jgi:3-deoxy-D-manno-octulosonate 8-phosphate phosphatase (KDO 8-P phosphatase)